MTDCLTGRPSACQPTKPKVVGTLSTLVKIAPKPTNPDHGAANQAPICQRCQAQFQLFENINAEVAALKPAPNQFLLIESVHAVIANWSQCTNCPRSYPHDFKIDSTHRLKSGIHDVNLDEIDKSLPFLGK